MSETTLQLSKPAWLTLQSPDGNKSARVDVYEARRMLDDAGKQPDEPRRYRSILNWIAGKLQVEPETLTESVALEFNDCIVRLVARHNEERQKKTESIAGSLTFTQASPATSEAGP